jgi:hypothetical protein
MINITAFSKKHPNGERNRGCVKSPELLDRIDNVLTSDEISAKELEDLEQVIRRTNTCVVTPWLMTDLYNLDGMIIKFDTTFVNPTVDAPKVDNTKKVGEPIKGTDMDGGVKGEPGVQGSTGIDMENLKGTDLGAGDGLKGPQGEPGAGTTEGTKEPAPESTQEPVNEENQEPAPKTQEPVTENGPSGDMKPTPEVVNEPAPESTQEPVNEENQEPAPETQEHVTENCPSGDTEPAPANDEQPEHPSEEQAAPKKGGRKKKEVAE